MFYLIKILIFLSFLIISLLFGAVFFMANFRVKDFRRGCRLLDSFIGFSRLIQ